VENPDKPTPSSEAAQALQQLKALPTFEDTKAQVQGAMDEIATAAGKIVPALSWETLDQGTSDNCQRPYEQTDGQRYFLPDRVAANVIVSEQDWVAIIEVAKGAAAKIAATDVRVIKDQPRDHDVWFSGPTGIFLKISYRGNLVISGYTGCRLPRDKK
jgi:Lipoprotein confined to pathogenic Mycobacterium